MIYSGRVVREACFIAGCSTIHACVWSRFLQAPTFRTLIVASTLLTILAALSVVRDQWWARIFHPRTSVLSFVLPGLSAALIQWLHGAGVLLVFCSYLCFVLWRAPLPLQHARIVHLMTLLVGPGLAFELEMLGAAMDKNAGRHLHLELSRYQRIEVIEASDQLLLFLDGHLQFSSLDESAYHAALVRPALESQAQDVLLVGGGDGLAARDLLPHVRTLTMVEIDPAVTALFSRHATLRALNQHAFQSSKLQLVHQDIRRFLERHHGQFDAIVIDLPDPSSPGMHAVYTVPLFEKLRARLRPLGVLSMQAVTLQSSAHARLQRMLKQAGWHPQSYSATVPSFGGNAAFLRANVARDSESDR